MTESLTAGDAPVPRRRNRRGEGGRLREDLLSAAREMTLEAGGSSGLSLRAVAARVGVAATSVYLHFEDIDALKLALAQRFFGEFASARTAAVSDIAEPAAALVAGCRAYATYGVSHPGAYRLMFGAELPAVVIAQAADSPSQSAFDSLVAAIRRCQESGAAPADTDPAELAVLVWSALHGQVVLRVDRPVVSWPPLDETVHSLVTRLVRLYPP